MTETLPAAAHRALGALNDLIEYCNDPGAEAFGARFELAQALSGHPRPAADPAPLRERIRRAICEADGFDFDQIEASDYQTHADAMLALLPAAPSAPADRAAILREAADALVAVAGQHPEARAVVIHWGDAAALLRTMAQEECDELEAQAHLDELADDLSRMADETQQPETQGEADCPYGEGPGDGSGCIKPAGHDGDHVVTPGVAVVPCSRAVLQQPHIPHVWWPQPGMAYVQCPGHSVEAVAASRTVVAQQADTAGEQQ
jgi:hypothetical protein